VRRARAAEEIGHGDPVAARHEGYRTAVPLAAAVAEGR
jgi:hypothetical protein